MSTFESPLLRAIRKGKEVAFYVPPDKPHYKYYALKSLERVMRRLGRDKCRTQTPKCTYIFEDTAHLNGELNERGQVVILVGPPPY